MTNEDLNLLNEISGYLIVHLKDLQEVNEFWNRFRNMVRAFRDFENSSTPESEALARWSIGDRRDDLHLFCHRHGFSAGEILQVEKMCRHCI